MRRRVTIVGGVILAAGLLLGWLGKGFLGLGGGEGPGSGPGDASQVRVQAPDSSSADEPPGSNTRTVSERSETEPAVASSAGAVDVVIDGETYLVRQESGREPAYQPIELDDLVARVQAAEGNSAGVRARISRRGTSIPVAEDKLDQALLQADIPRTAIVWVEETAP